MKWERKWWWVSKNTRSPGYRHLLILSLSQVLSVTQNRACTAKMNLNYYQIIIYKYNSIQHIATVWPANIQRDTHRNFSLTHNIPVSLNWWNCNCCFGNGRWEQTNGPALVCDWQRHYPVTSHEPFLMQYESLNPFLQSLSFTWICKWNRNREAWQYLHPNLHTTHTIV